MICRYVVQFCNKCSRKSYKQLKNKCNWHFSQIVTECTPAVFIIHIFPMCYVLAFFRDERCCRVLELSCYLCCLNQERVGGYLRTKYCRTSCHIFELVAWSWAVAEWLDLGESFNRSKTQPANASGALAPCCLFCCVYKNRGSDLHLPLSDFSFEVFGHRFYFSGKVKRGPGPCPVLLDTTAAVNNALPWITAASLKLINLAVTQIWRSISP